MLHQRTRRLGRRASTLERIAAERRQRFRAALESSAVSFVLLRAVRDEAGRAVGFQWSYLSKAAASLMRHSASELIGHRVEDVLPGAPIFAQKLLELCLHVVDSDLPGESDLCLQDHGINGWFRVVVSRFGDGVSVWFSDVTQYYRSAQDALDSEEELRTITALMRARVARCTADLRYRWVSRAMGEWLGWRSEDIAGRPIHEIIGDAAFAALLPRFNDVLAGKRVEYEQEVDYRSIGRRWIRAAYVPAHAADGSVDGWVAVVTDITERKQLELRLLQADRHKNEFLAVLAHELRNPLAPLGNGLQIARLHMQQDSPLAPTVDMMDRQLSHLVRLVDDLFDVSRIAQGKMQLRRKPLALTDTLSSSIESCRSLIETHDHELAVDVPTEPLFVEGDFQRLVQLFTNLLSNSAKYTGRGGRIRVALEKEEGEAVVRVSDTGIGIPPDRLDDIFDMFSQLRPDGTEPHDGLGIGLALARSLVVMHGGSVRAFSAGPGTGSTFEVRLPLISAPVDAKVSTKIRVDSPLRALRVPSLRILVVDPNTDASDSLATLLRLKGHEVRTAADEYDALEQAQAFQPRLIFLDIAMARLDGYKTARAIRAQPWGTSIRLIALSGWGTRHERARAAEAGFDAHFTKPLDPVALEALLGTTD